MIFTVIGRLVAVDRCLSGAAEARRDAMAEWYMASWKLSVSIIRTLSCRALSSVSTPNLLAAAERGRGSSSNSGAAAGGCASMYSGAHHLAPLPPAPEARILTPPAAADATHGRAGAGGRTEKAAIPDDTAIPRRERNQESKKECYTDERRGPRSLSPSRRLSGPGLM
nr:unnamed protein product [Digitaria exilis]